MQRIKIAYLGGGSKQWARVFMNDLALTPDLTGEIALYDIDIEAVNDNKIIGELINQHEYTISKWDYQIYLDINDALKGADFVIISILPATFQEMNVDVHLPEKYGVFQTVGDTVGPGGILRSMRTVPIFEEFASSIKANCPNAWVINLTNPMSLCVKTLYDVFPEIKAFGCCHEVFHTQEFLCKVLEIETGIKASRKEIYTDVTGINHFTWFTKASYQNTDLFPLLDSFIKKYGEIGYFERGNVDDYLASPFAYANIVKMDLYKRYGILAAAGDRHLVEFLDQNLYMKEKAMINKNKFALTTVPFRIMRQERLIQERKAIINGEKQVELKKSNEELVDLIKAILGLGNIVSNVNLPNRGQIKDAPIGAIVETNAVFSNNFVLPVITNEMPFDVKALVFNHIYLLEALYKGIKERNLDKIFNVFINQPINSNLTYDEAANLFNEMTHSTKKYLDSYYKI